RNNVTRCVGAPRSPMRLASSCDAVRIEQGEDGGICPVAWTDELQTQGTSGIDQVALGELRRAVDLRDARRLVERDGIGRSLAAEKLVDYGPAAFVDADRDELEPLRIHGLRELPERRLLVAARRAPGRPEVQQDDLAAVRRQIELLSVACGQGKRRRGDWRELVRVHRGGRARCFSAEVLNDLAGSDCNDRDDGESDERFLQPSRHDPDAPRRLRHARVAAGGLFAHRESLSTSCRALTRCLKARRPSISITGMSYRCAAYRAGSDSMSTSRQAKSTSARASASASFASSHKQQSVFV